MIKIPTTHAWRRIAAVVTVATLLPFFSTGCFGSFKLLKKTYRFNQEIDQDKWVQWFVFLVISIIPIYGLATLIDLVFANSVEFWTGENPITSDVHKTVYSENGEVASATFHPDGTTSLVITDADGRVHSMTIVREGDTLVAHDPDGRLLGRVAKVDGELAFQN